MAEEKTKKEIEAKKVKKETKHIKKSPKIEEKGMVAVVTVRSPIGAKKEVKDTLKMLKIFKKNSCTIRPISKPIKGMIQKAKDFITWGNIDDKTIKMLEKAKGKQTTYHLNPPRKGFGRKGIKKPFKLGGALGNREEKINDLIQRMLQ